MLHKFAACAAVLVALGHWVTPATATVGLRIFDQTDADDQVEIRPGQSFDVWTELDSPVGLFGLTYNFRISSNGSGKFSITDRGIAARNPFNDPMTLDDRLLEPAAALLDPANDRDLGATVLDIRTIVPPGVYTLARFTITSASNMAPGTYILDSTDIAMVATPTFEELPLVVRPYTIMVSPATGGTGGSPGGTGTGGTGTPGGTPGGGTGGEPSGTGTVPPAGGAAPPLGGTTPVATPTEPDTPASSGATATPATPAPPAGNASAGATTATDDASTEAPEQQRAPGTICGAGAAGACLSCSLLFLFLMRRRT